MILILLVKFLFFNFIIILDFPVFDKSLHNGQGDRIASFEKKKCDLLIFEGWFNGYRHIENLKPENINSKFYNSNNNLKNYEKYWDMCNELIIIKPELFNYSFTWRENAEKKQGKGMNSQEIKEFVQYFLDCLPPDQYYENILANRNIHKNNLIVEIDIDHKIKYLK